MGGDRKSESHNDTLKTESDLAEELERIESTRANERKVAGKGIDHKDGRPEGQASNIQRGRKPSFHPLHKPRDIMSPETQIR